ncbi:hypothetical protein CTA1_3370 [Colletotrichum tanaceti]|uniref:Uncharacterized protein n=1 Tax=Colletotrichum tanaceti TaxID=1306861 RepID=A0A4U6WZX2_9PEZI|nr:hypothetical protein CTA1_3370 [Colletotrichum tanaceti]
MQALERGPALDTIIAAGDDVVSLTLVDSPAPVRGIEVLQKSIYGHCLHTGIFRSEMCRDTVTRTDGGRGPGGAVSGVATGAGVGPRQKWVHPRVARRALPRRHGAAGRLLRLTLTRRGGGEDARDHFLGWAYAEGEHHFSIMHGSQMPVNIHNRQKDNDECLGDRFLRRLASVSRPKRPSTRHGRRDDAPDLDSTSGVFEVRRPW